MSGDERRPEWGNFSALSGLGVSFAGVSFVLGALSGAHRRTSQSKARLVGVSIAARVLS